MIHGPNLKTIKERAKVLLRPAADPMASTYARKAQEAQRVSDGFSSELLEEEAAIREVTVKALAADILRRTRDAQDLAELNRISSNLAVDRAETHEEVLKILASKGIDFSI